MAKQKVRYVDGFVLVVPKKKLEAYRKMAADGKRIWMKHGALDYKECVGDDLKHAHVTLPFPKIAKLKKGELVIFSYIGFASRAHRDKVNAKVMKDPAMDPEMMKDFPMDMKRFAYGGFKVIVGN